MSKAHEAMIRTFAAQDPHSIGVIKFLEALYPAFADRVFKRNDFLGILVRSGMNPMDVLDYPICGRCECLAAMNDYGMKDGKIVGRATCFTCGHHTLDPITLREWMVEELKKKAPPAVAMAAEAVVDQIALSYMRSVQDELNRAILGQSAQRSILQDDRVTRDDIKVHMRAPKEDEYRTILGDDAEEIE